MKYESWLTYPNMTMAIQLKKGAYHCSEFTTSQERKASLKICSSTLELKFYLLSFPKPPKKEILSLINLLENNKTGPVALN